MKSQTLDTLDTLISANQAVTTARTPSLDAVLQNLLHAREAQEAHNTQMAALAQEQQAAIEAKRAELAALEKTVAAEAAATV